MTQNAPDPADANVNVILSHMLRPQIRSLALAEELLTQVDKGNRAPGPT